MRKILYVLIISAFLKANPIASIIASVNNEPITNIDILEVSQYMNIDQNEALKLLIQNKICTSLAKNFKLGVNQIEINEELSKIAAANNVSLDTFIEHNQDKIKILSDNIKDEILKRKLFDLIAQNYMKDVSDDEIIRFYNLNKDKMNGASYEMAKEQIKNYLINKNAQESVRNYMEKEEAKASIKMFR
ncbi:hypothetical protein AVANS14531_05515 [Campylobacter sp. Cr9]|uniref:hypothetical protein n=1 Tax=unclassified Campylobacter TaxID=2593542 RepID=UPI001EFA3673|nr:hypothetical protein [Campylobacter sp. RM5004]MBZ7985793.1 hypothetical protein [Campylobacter sp. Cr9]ULO00816.1 hypothetical protein AVANS_0164 [Campylobacter sp. RM5004]